MRAERLSREFAAALDCASAATAAPPTGSLVGVEHEFRAVRDGTAVDFGPILDALDLGRLHLDPGDVNARRLSSGAAVTCDGTEAEIALPPLATAPGFSLAVRQRADAERAALCGLLGPATSLSGTSTHLSVAVDGGPHMVDAVARRYARTFAAALMLLFDARDSYGIYVRPRPGRLEVCGEYVTGPRLAAAAVFAVGSVAACAAAAVAGAPPEWLALDVAVEPAGERYGYTVHRHAFGGDLYTAGRTAPLTRAGGGSLSAQDHLEAAWTAARAELCRRGCSTDCAGVDALVGASSPLPVTLTAADVVTRGDSPSVPVPPPAACGRLAATIHRPRYDMAAVMLTWDAAVLVVSGPSQRHAFVSIPRSALDTFFMRLDAGDLDPILLRYLRRRSRGRSLVALEQVHRPGLFDSLGSRRDLLPAELDGPPLAAAA